MVELGNERALCAEGPDGRESAEGRGEVREERRPRHALKALHRPRGGHVELAHEVEEREHGDARQQDQRLRQANDGHQAQNGHEGLKSGTWAKGRFSEPRARVSVRQCRVLQTKVQTADCSQRECRADTTLGSLRLKLERRLLKVESFVKSRNSCVA